ncbi:alpha-fibrinogenase albofibrase-like [Coccinella septempunctata]|uniref:alpha-fibrinogenase albofibrase-like n=1 Tax=Coccinella septempunctata TaxID=41139 RepID=UPI001D093FCD|nr:alpha-fibrinogenase albofibrase-like [Coccinella septempunctata]
MIQNDIALLELGEPLENNAFIRPIALSSKDPKPGTICRVSGWGLTKEGETVLIAHPYLKEIEVSILPSKECFLFFSWMSFDNSKICGFSEKGCPNLGDSGGPLICKDHLSGVISFGRMHHCLGAANCFTSTHYHHNWIQYIISQSEYKRRNGDYLTFKFIDIFKYFNFFVKSLKKFFIF